MILYFWGGFLDVTGEHVTDKLRIIFCLSILMSLVKIVYLVRVFKSLNFLVTMLSHVVHEVTTFMMLFGIFILTFAECNAIVQVDIASYGRLPGIIAHFIDVLRCSMGDFHVIDAKKTFDIVLGYDDDGNEIYRFSNEIVYFRWILYLISIFYLFMIFMNFIIAVISDSYSSITENKDSHDSQQRVEMIFERELHFSAHQFEDKRNFPDVIIIRKMKDQD
jgi:hypothetical protein